MDKFYLKQLEARAVQLDSDGAMVMRQYNELRARGIRGLDATAAEVLHELANELIKVRRWIAEEKQRLRQQPISA